MNLAVVPKLRARASLNRPQHHNDDPPDTFAVTFSEACTLVCAFCIGAVLFVWGVAKVAMWVIDMAIVAAGVR